MTAGVSDEAIEAAAKAVSLDWQSYVASMRLALEAAQPFMQCSCPHISEVDDYCPQHGRDS